MLWRILLKRRGINPAISIYVEHGMMRKSKRIVERHLERARGEEPFVMPQLGYDSLSKPLGEDVFKPTGAGR